MLEALVEENLSEQLVGHISRDATAIVGNEKPEKKEKIKVEPKKKGHPKIGRKQGRRERGNAAE